MKEIWKDIYGYEGIYRASNLGRIKSLKNNIILKQSINCGYKYVSLCKNGKIKNIRVHRIIANTFLDKRNYKCSIKEKEIDYNKLVINHKDCNKQNNVWTNLEWCTISYNSKHAYQSGLLKNNLKPQYGCNNGMAKSIQQYNLKNELLNEYEYMTQASKELNISISAISLCCKNKRKTAGGYIWKYK